MTGKHEPYLCQNKNQDGYTKETKNEEQRTKNGLPHWFVVLFVVAMPQHTGRLEWQGEK
ncbi:MAG: hypothetical protein IJK42_12555 [Prevotella sp.]|nr:hypothetical protein [Prevotella sp.]MBQ6210582.1 hypothetical protein [Prevotella sp.]